MWVGLYRRVCKVVVVVLFSLRASAFLVGDLLKRLRPGGFDNADAEREVFAVEESDGAEGMRKSYAGMRESAECFRAYCLVPECGGVGYSAGMLCALRFGMLGAG